MPIYNCAVLSLTTSGLLNNLHYYKTTQHCKTCYCLLKTLFNCA